MKITSVRIYLLKGNPSVEALADIVLDGGLSVSDLRVCKTKTGGLCVLYPISQQSSEVNVRHICNPINRPTQRLIEDAVLKAYWEEKKTET